jgi:hypothetical protein
VPISRSAIRELELQSRHSPKGWTRLPCWRCHSCELHPNSRTTRFRFTTAFPLFVSTRPLRASNSQPNSPPFSFTCPGRLGQLGHLSPHGDPGAPLARLTSRTSTPQGCGMVVTPVVIDQCQQPTILFSRDGNPRLGSLCFAHPYASQRLTVHAVSSRPRCPCLHVARVVSSRRNNMCSEHASSPNGSPAERSLWTTEALLHD